MTHERKTIDAFNYQWQNLNYGRALPNDNKFMSEITSHITELSGIDSDWFHKKQIIDIGCGTGRFTKGFTKLTPDVTACDISTIGVEKTKQLCPNAHVFQHDILNQFPSVYHNKFDLVWSFGVIHHVTKPIQALRNIAELIKPYGTLFIMVYGYPTNWSERKQQFKYMLLRRLIKGFPVDKKFRIIKYIVKRYIKDPNGLHGWFDAVAPEINKLYSLSEITRILETLSFHDITKINNDALQCIRAKL